ncbi:MAG: hypothetical protein JWO68_2101, partial [Actinomycetia bacterium]|nr:hypothetical protein [Actinomycetes bacterium]
MTTEHDQGDYVLVHKSKAKISRARKMIIGVMAIGAVAAMTNAGTFASFSAATQNDATFQSGRIVLTNTVPGGQTCFSDGTAANNTQSADLNTNNNTNCTGLGFGTFLVPGSIATANITLVNKSDTAAPLAVFATAACANNDNTTGG